MNLLQFQKQEEFLLREYLTDKDYLKSQNFKRQNFEILIFEILKFFKMKKIKITLVKSPIDRSERQKLTLQALGLNKMNATREVEATDQIRGMVRKVEHMITVEEVA